MKSTAESQQTFSTFQDLQNQALKHTQAEYGGKHFTAMGAIELFLLDMIVDLKQRCLSVVDELQNKGRVAIKRASYFENYFLNAIKKEKGQATSVLTDAYASIKKTHTHLAFLCEEMNQARKLINTYFGECQAEIKLLEKRHEDAKKIMEMRQPMSQTENSPQELCGFIGRHPVRILKGAQEFYEWFSEIRSESEVVSSIEALSNAGQETLERMEDIFLKCINLRAPCH
jgi:hypothetical protein